MFRCLPVRMRNFPSALLLSIPLAFSVEAFADPGDYRVKGETRSSGVRIVQQADAVTFPQFGGSHAASSAPDAPGIEAGHLRAVRLLTPRSGDSTIAIASQDGSTHIVVEFFNRHVLVGYGGPSMSESTDPFMKTDRQTTWQPSERRWQQVIPTGGKLSANATHFIVTLYVIPRFGSESQPKGKTNLLLSVNEATVQGMHVVSGRLLADNVMLAVDERNWSHWRQDPLRAGIVSLNHGSVSPTPAFARHPLFVEQRTIDLRADAGARRRDKRCMADVAYEVSNLMFPLLMEIYFGRADLCSLDPHPNQDIAAPLPLIEVMDRQDVPRNIEPTVFEASAFNPAELGHTDAFDAAMDIQFCNANHRGADGEEPCTDEDQRATAAMGNLTPQEIDELLAQIARMYEPDQQGTGTLRTGNAELDRWLNADLLRAEQALIAAKSIVRVSSANDEPKKTVKKKRKKNENDETQLVKASCVVKHGSSDELRDDSGGEFQRCVKRATKKMRGIREFVGLTPHIDDNERFHLRDTQGFNRLVNEFRNTGGSLPDGMSGDQFSRFTAAIARDPAPTGDNVGFVFINDPTLRGNARFRYGIEHIWAPGRGGGDNAGHREDWQDLKGLSVKDRAMLTEVIMAALTDRSARFAQTRSRNGNVVRTFDYFMFRHGQHLFTIRNVRIVLGQNGMVITAYPLRNARADSLEM